jgi:hypothetical protein
MRLLHFDTSGKLASSVFSRDIPPYAVLSHTWGDDEFLYEDLVNQTGTKKAGYEKIISAVNEPQRTIYSTSGSTLVALYRLTIGDNALLIRRLMPPFSPGIGSLLRLNLASRIFQSLLSYAIF